MCASYAGDMDPRSKEKRFQILLSRVMLTIQGVLFMAVIVGAFAQGVGPHLPSSVPVGTSIVALGLVGLFVSGRYLGRSLSPSPIPNHAGLVAHGPYRWVRHPIYTSVVGTFLGVALSAGTVIPYVAIAILIALFEVKVYYEEKWLAPTYDGYGEYAARTGKFVPGLGKRRATPRVPSRPSDPRRTLVA